jgi:hypothetical protein
MPNAPNTDGCEKKPENPGLEKAATPANVVLRPRPPRPAPSSGRERTAFRDRVRILTCTNLPIVLALPNCRRDSRSFSTRTPGRPLLSRSVKVRLSVTYAKLAMSAVIAPTGLKRMCPLGYPLLVQASPDANRRDSRRLRQYQSRSRDNPHRLWYTNNGSNQENHT